MMIQKKCCLLRLDSTNFKARRSKAIAQRIAVVIALLLTPMLAGVTTAEAQTPSLFGETVTQAVLGGFHSCALTSAGTVRCWGHNRYGQLGNSNNNGTNVSQPTPQLVSGLSGVVSLAAGVYHACALTSAGAVLCWGHNNYGQLGNASNSGTENANPTPLAVSGLSGVVAIAAGEFYTCALTSSGTVQCWGLNGSGQLGNGSNLSTENPNPTPQTISGLAGVVAMSTGGNHACALTKTGALQCWGRNYHGQLGNSSNNGSGAGNPTPQTISGLSGILAVTAGSDHTCAVTSSGAAYCWGWNYSGELGNVSNVGTSDANPNPMPVTGLGSGVAAISAQAQRTCAVTSGSALQCWGSNIFGALGNSDNLGTNNPNPTPQTVSGISDVVAIAAGGSSGHACALTRVGEMKCWGLNNRGQLGNPGNPSTGIDPTPTPQPVAVLANTATAIATGVTHSCALTRTGGVQCWGRNNRLQLGDGTGTGRLSPVAVNGLSSGVVGISTKGEFTCALTAVGGVKCWGFNFSGQLGVGDTINRATPVDVTGLSGITAISAGIDHACAVTASGGVKCWGLNNVGQLGNGTIVNSLVPVDVTGLSNVVEISVGALHSCARSVTGEVKCWGYNAYGQLGTGNFSNSSVPVLVSSLGAATSNAIAAGYYHTCAAIAAGSVKCWGFNAEGELGNGTSGTATNSTTAVDVIGIGGSVTSIRANRGYTCVRTNVGGMKCWGWSDYGQLGNGNTTTILSAVDVSGLASGVAAISVGYYYGCALTTAGELKCWGLNDAGQLGDGDVTQRLTPVTIRSGQSMSFSAPTTASSGANITLSATASSGLPVVTFDTWTPTTCTVSGNSVTVTGPDGGLCGVRASQPGLAPLPAGGSVAPAPQQLRLIQIQITQVASSTSVTSSLNPTNFGASVTLTAQVTGSTSPLPTGTVSFSDGATPLGTVALNGSASASLTTSALSIGSHSITAAYSGDANNFASPSAALTQVVNANTQTITNFTPVSPVVFGAAAQTLTATPGASSSPLLFSLTSAPCVLAGASLSYTGAGSCVLAVNQAADANYNAASPVTATVVVGKANQAIVFGASPSIVVGSTGTVSATGGLSGNVVTFSSTTTAVCTSGGTNGATITALTAGNCIIAADQLGNGNYNAAPQVLQTIGVGKASQTITGFAPTTPVVFGAAAQTLAATPGASTSPLVFSLTSGPCALAGASLSYTGAGSCVVAVNQAADANYNAAGQVSAAVVVNKADQAIVFGAAPSIAVGGTGSVSATGGVSGNAVTFTSTTPTICTVSGATVTAILGGNCILAANQLGNGNYNAAPPVTQTIAIGASSSTMTITSSANPSRAGQPITFNVVVTPGIPSVVNSSYLKASTQPSAIPTGSVTFADNGNLIATVMLNANGQASFSTSSLLAGNHAITANYAGDASNAAASATVIQAVDALIVPTLSAWMLALLGLLLVTFALRARRNV